MSRPSEEDLPWQKVFMQVKRQGDFHEKIVVDTGKDQQREVKMCGVREHEGD